MKRITRSFAVVVSLALTLASLPASAFAAGMALGKTGLPQPVVSVPVGLNSSSVNMATMPGDLVAAPQSVMTDVFVSPAIQPAPTPERAVIAAEAEIPGAQVQAGVLPVETKTATPVKSKSLLEQLKAAVLNLGSKKVNWDNSAQRPELNEPPAASSNKEVKPLLKKLKSSGIQLAVENTDKDTARTKISAKVMKQAEAAAKIVSNSFGYPEKSAKDRTLRKLRFWTEKPVGSKTFKQKLDSTDNALYELTASYQVEFGRFEAQNSKGETLGLSLFTSNKPNFLAGPQIADAMHDVFAQAWATGEYFEIKKVLFTHTHPSEKGDPDLFSEEDIRSFNSIKTKMEALGLKTSSLEASILYENFFVHPVKKTLAVSATSSVANGSYTSDAVDTLKDPLVRAALMYDIAVIGDKIVNGELTQGQLVMRGLQPYINAFVSIFKTATPVPLAASINKEIQATNVPSSQAEQAWRRQSKRELVVLGAIVGAAAVYGIKTLIPALAFSPVIGWFAGALLGAYFFDKILSHNHGILSRIANAAGMLVADLVGVESGRLEEDDATVPASPIKANDGPSNSLANDRGSAPGDMIGIVAFIALAMALPFAYWAFAALSVAMGIYLAATGYWNQQRSNRSAASLDRAAADLPRVQQARKRLGLKPLNTAIDNTRKDLRASNQKNALRITAGVLSILFGSAALLVTLMA